MEKNGLFSIILDTYDFDNPFFASEILDLVGNFSKAYIYRLLNELIAENKVRKYSQGVYFVPKKTSFGLSTITAYEAIEKQYISCNDKIFGIKTGVTLLNKFGITTQVPNIIEIVTNNETTRIRRKVVNERVFILRKSRCEINEDNYMAYEVLELLNSLNDKQVIERKSKIQSYVKENNLFAEITKLAKDFPGKTAKRMVLSEICSHEIA
ncbi:MAG TPA: DUF6088 family protein [Bacilli bacterium]|nr:DUF6088 family protein [Bacilli bacterium]